MCPLLLNSFTMHPPNAFCKVEGICRLTWSAMARKVEFRDQVGEVEVINIKVQVVLGKTFEMIDGPFTGDVIGNNDITNCRVFQHGGDDIICVDIPGQRLGYLHDRMDTHILFTTL